MSAQTRRAKRDASSRRQLLVLATGAAAALSACGEQPELAEPEVPDLERDVAVLTPVLDQEHAAIAAYGALMSGLDGRELATVREFRTQEREHAAQLTAAIRRLGGEPRGPRSRPSYAASFPSLHDRDGALEFAVDVEQTAIAAYLEALGKLSTAALRAQAAVILATEAEQLSVLLEELGLTPIPSAFVGGEPLPI